MVCKPDRRSALPPNDLVSAVFLLAMKDDLIVAVRNERGRDIPGGHVEAGETPEGAAATFAWAEPFAIVSVPARLQVMLFYATSAFEPSALSGSGDALKRGLLSTRSS